MKDNKGTKMNKLSIKIEFYILSLWLLFVLIFLLTVDIPIAFLPDAEFIGFLPLIKRNWLAIISLLMALTGVIISCRLKHKFRGTHNPPTDMISIKNENYEYLTFLTTYVNVLERNLGFNELVFREASTSVEAIDELKLLEDIQVLKDSAEDVSFARKLSKVKKLPLSLQTIFPKRLL